MNPAAAIDLPHLLKRLHLPTIARLLLSVITIIGPTSPFPDHIRWEKALERPRAA